MGSKNLGNTLMGNPKEKTVNTEKLFIQGHLLRWEDVIIQISNISLITSANVTAPQFPLWALIMAVVGLVLLKPIWYIGLILIAIAIFAFFAWYSSVQDAKNSKYLNILLNSGQTYLIMFQSKHFLNDVLQVFANIFEEGPSGNTNYYINIKDSKIDHNSSIIRSVAE